MTATGPDMALEDLSSWAEKAGIELNGIAPRLMPGKGTGIVATREIKAGDIVLEAPTSAIQCLDNISDEDRSKLRWKEGDGTPESPRISLQGILAAHPLITPKANHDLWISCAPSIQTFRDGFPIMWSEDLHEQFLPLGIRYLVNRQRAKFENDWSIVKDILLTSRSPTLTTSLETTKEQYLHLWLLISSRTFYNLTPLTKSYPHDDRLALIPMADFFNHNSSGPDVTAAFDQESYTYTATRAITRGEEICISYGNHSNDFLLAEYGFFLFNPPYNPNDPDENNKVFQQTNPHDSICLDDAIFLSKTWDKYHDELIQAHREHPNINGPSSNANDSNEKLPEYYNTVKNKDLGNYQLAFRASSSSASKGTNNDNNNNNSGNYEIFLSRRTRFALSILLGGRENAPYVLFTSNEEWDAECTQDAEVTALLDKLLISTQGWAAHRLALLEDLTVIRTLPEGPRLMLTERWKQIMAMADASVIWLRNRNLS